MSKTDTRLEPIPTRLQDRISRSRAQLAELNLVLRGTIGAYHTTCGQPTCRCRQDPGARHGPYYQWSTKVDGKTRSVRLKQEDLPLYRSAIRNGQRLDKLVATWMAASMEALELIKNVHRNIVTISGLCGAGDNMHDFPCRPIAKSWK